MTQCPRVHINGTDGHMLLQEYGAAIEALQAAIETLQMVTVHGRDYYVIARPPGAPDPVSVAHDEHYRRHQKLLDVRDELQTIALNIAVQLHAKMEAER